MKKRVTTLLLLFFFVANMQAQETKQEEDQTYFSKGSLSLRTNLLPWAVITPNLGLEYKPSDRIGIVLDGAYAHWDWDNDNKRHRLWLVNPQVRYYTGMLKGSYVGLEGKLGQYCLKWSGSDTKGNQGDFVGGGLTIGHQFSLAKNLMVDLGISAGYLYLHNKETFTHIDGNDYRTNKGSNGYWGPTGASITFVWKIN